MKIISWNVNGIRAVLKKGFWDWFDQEDADMVCLQEVKAFHHQLPPDVQTPMGWHSVWHEGTRPGYAGTLIYSKHAPLSKKALFEGRSCFSDDGRVTEMKFSDFTLINCYFPNGQTRSNGQEMLSYKLNFYKEMLDYVESLRAVGEKVIVCGDFNICHKRIDIARPDENKNSIGFLPVEREWLDRFVAKGYVDVFRHFHPDLPDSYTWWTYRGGARERNVGWRLDYFFVSPDLLESVVGFEHQTRVMGSDHCPVKMVLDM